MPTPKNLGFTTRAIHAGEEPDPTTGAHGVPIYQNSTFALGTMDRFQEFWDGVPNAWGYTRDGNPTVDHLERKVADLEGAESCVSSASGMGAISATLLTVGANGGHIVTAQQIYNTANKLVNEDLPQYGVTFSRVDITDLDAVEAAITPQDHRDLYRGLFQSRFDRGRCAGAGQDRPQTWVAAHHRQHLSLPGALPAAGRWRRSGDPQRHQISGRARRGAGRRGLGFERGNRAIRAKALRLGSTLSPFAAWLIMTGMRTLPLRMERHSHNGRAVAAFLAAHPAVASWHYPGLPDDPGHATATDCWASAGNSAAWSRSRSTAGPNRSRHSSNR